MLSLHILWGWTSTKTSEHLILVYEEDQSYLYFHLTPMFWRQIYVEFSEHIQIILVLSFNPYVLKINICWILRTYTNQRKLWLQRNKYKKTLQHLYLVYEGVQSQLDLYRVLLVGPHDPYHCWIWPWTWNFTWKNYR